MLACLAGAKREEGGGGGGSSRKRETRARNMREGNSRLGFRAHESSILSLARVHNRFGGTRDLANFCGDIRDGS